MRNVFTVTANGNINDTVEKITSYIHKNEKYVHSEMKDLEKEQKESKGQQVKGITDNWNNTQKTQMVDKLRRLSKKSPVILKEI